MPTTVRLAEPLRATEPAMVVVIFPETLATETDALVRVGPPRLIERALALIDQLFESVNVPESCTWVVMMVTVPETFVTSRPAVSVMVTVAPLRDNEPKVKVLVDAFSDQVLELV